MVALVNSSNESVAKSQFSAAKSERSPIMRSLRFLAAVSSRPKESFLSMDWYSDQMSTQASHALM
eukprot:8788862-Alexandrium_andersonii.AAC.1